MEFLIKTLQIKRMLRFIKNDHFKKHTLLCCLKNVLYINFGKKMCQTRYFLGLTGQGWAGLGVDMI